MVPWLQMASAMMKAILFSVAMMEVTVVIIVVPRNTVQNVLALGILLAMETIQWLEMEYVMMMQIMLGVTMMVETVV